MVSPSSQALILIVPFSFSNHKAQCLFVIYTTPLSSLIKASSVDHYLNQIKLLNFFFHSSFSNSIDNLLHVVQQISSWMTSNLLFMSKFSSISAAFCCEGRAWSLGHNKLLCSEGPFRLWVHQPGMMFPFHCSHFLSL